VPYGPRAYRASIRSTGPVLGLVPSAVLGAAWWLLKYGNASALRGAASFLAAVLAAPALLVAGAPLRSGTAVYLAAVAASVVLWLVVGAVAARRATAKPIATWRDYWREFGLIAGAIWAGTVVALVAANLVLGRAFL
jgi:hypothetical protein